MTAALLVIVLSGVLFAALQSPGVCAEGEVEVPCPTDPVGPDGQRVSDKFFFVHRPLGENGAITVRLTSMTGIITYPPPDHDEIVRGLVPWAKAGVIIKDGTAQGSSYAALMLTGRHGVRMQYDYVHDVAGRPGGVSPQSPRWLRLTRSGDTVTGHESADGVHWTKVGTARLRGLPATVRVGLFVASPGDLTIKRGAFGGSTTQSRFTQATAVFDTIRLDGAPNAGWSTSAIGEMGRTDWERHHRAPGLVESNSAFTVTGSGDIAPATGGSTVSGVLIGLPIGLIIVLATAVRFARPGNRPDRATPTTSSSRPRTARIPTARTPAAHPPTAGTAAAQTPTTQTPAEQTPAEQTPAEQTPATRTPTTRTPATRILAARALVIGAAAVLVGLVAAGIVVPLGPALLRANGTDVPDVSVLTGLRVVISTAALLAVAAVFALALGTLLRRAWAAMLAAVSLVVLPYLLGALPLLPDEAAERVLSLTPAAAFAVQQTLREYPQVVAHYTPSGGYFPLPWWAGLAVLCAYTAAALALAARRPRRTTPRET
ncbi:DUF1349 domain-containing protein [Thermomonospora amylolytica]|uniref:hypothetical protein n=1 Tax=Thermomonospora amylolytica TaxID=1411117 RepID=UPI0018E4E290|nr:hypothetical protein [Thermomonospora amylolytica]